MPPLIWLLLKELGVRPLIHYARYRTLLRTGLITRRTPTYAWTDRPLAWWVTDSKRSLGRFVFDGAPPALSRLRRLQAEIELPAAEAAEEILRGEFRLFGHPPLALGFPPDWGQVPFDDQAIALPADRHWTSYTGDQLPDFRLLWELSRFGWAYPLAGAYLLERDRRFADGFFALLVSWRAANPPNAGPNWVSAQEAALRIMALSFAWFAFGDLLENDDQRRERLLTTIAVHAERIPPTLAYAQAQRNNHLISEAVGLYSAGLLFPMLRPAGRWKSTGRRLLVDALGDQIFPDGGYLQHSTNYHRLALSAGLWMARLAELNEEPLPGRSLDALRRLTRALATLLDPASGRAPNLGSNDGSDVLPLSGCDHQDFRPVVQAASLAFDGGPALAAGPWDALALWLGLLPVQAGEGRLASAEADRDGPAPAALAGRPATIGGLTVPGNDLAHAGLYLLRGELSWAMLRCAQFASRPSQSDQLHLDLWWRGCNLARDPGSYRYTESGLETAMAHNTLVADDREPMRRIGRFLWLAGRPAEFLGRWRSDDGRVESIAAEHELPGGLVHRRSLVRAGDTLWVVIDELAGPGAHQARLAWQLPDWEWELQAGELLLRGGPDEVRLRIEPDSADLTLYRAGKRLAGISGISESPTVGPSADHQAATSSEAGRVAAGAAAAGGKVLGRQAGDQERLEPAASVGWWAPSYGRRQPALSLIVRLRGPLPLRLASWWQLGEPDPGLEFADGPLAQLLKSGS